MNKILLAVSSIILSSASVLAVAQTADEHNEHHPALTVTGEASMSPQTQGDPVLLEKQMGAHMQTMHAFHEKLQKANPEERQALMSEHHALMQEGMKMMGMASSEMQSMGMMGGMHSQAVKNHSTEA